MILNGGIDSHPRIGSVILNGDYLSIDSHLWIGSVILNGEIDSQPRIGSVILNGDYLSIDSHPWNGSVILNGGIDSHPRIGSMILNGDYPRINSHCQVCRVMLNAGMLVWFSQSKRKYDGKSLEYVFTFQSITVTQPNNSNVGDYGGVSIHFVIHKGDRTKQS